MSSDECRCRPIGFLLGLPFAFVAIAIAISLVGVVVWILGSLVSLVCPCFVCVTLLVELALGLIQLPFVIITWFTDQIPC